MMRQLFRCGLALWLWCPVSALALEVSEIQVQSALNQLFDATIPLPTLIPEDISKVSVKVASPAMFEEFGLDQTSTLENLVFSIQYDEESRVYVKVISTQPIREPSLALLLEFGWPRGKTFREFTVLLDPVKRLAQRPGGRTKTVLSEPAVVVAKPATVVAATETREASPEASLLPVETSSTDSVEQPAQVYGPVAPGEGLWGIALKLRPEGITREQMMQALFKANPEAFSSAGIDGLKIGATLRVPSYREIADLTGSPVALRLAAVEESALAPKKLPDAAPPQPTTAPEEPTKTTASDPEIFPLTPTPTLEPTAPVELPTSEAASVASLIPDSSPPTGEERTLSKPTPAVATVEPEPQPESVPEPVQALEPAPQPEPVQAPEPASQPEVVQAPEPTPQPEAVQTPEPAAPKPESVPEPVQAPEPTPQPEVVQALEPVPEPEQAPEPVQAPELTPEPTTPEPVAMTSQPNSPLLEPVSATPLLSLVAAEITAAATQTFMTIASEQETSVAPATRSGTLTPEVATTEVLPLIESPIPESTEEPFSQPPVEASPSALPATGPVEEPLPAEPPLTKPTKQASDKPSVTEPAQPPRPRYKGGDQYGPVSSNERLWNIADKVAPDPGIDRDTMMKALFMANPQAFSKSSMDYLKEGAVLRIPTLREIVEYTGSSVAQQLLEKQANHRRRKKGD